MRTFEEVQDELRECINHAYRDECEDMQKFGSNIGYLDKAIQRLNELIEIHKAEVICPHSDEEVAKSFVEDVEAVKEWLDEGNREIYGG